jgi:hypothetical protein
MRTASTRSFECAASRMSNAAQRLLRRTELRKLIDVPRIFFRIHDAKASPHSLGNFQQEALNVGRCSATPLASH